MGNRPAFDMCFTGRILRKFEGVRWNRKRRPRDANFPKPSRRYRTQLTISSPANTAGLPGHIISPWPVFSGCRRHNTSTVKGR